MKFHASELPLGKPQPRRRTSKLAPLVALTVLLTIPLYYPSIRDSTKKLSPADESLEEETIKPVTTHLETPPENDNKPVGESLEEELTRPVTTLLETPPENDDKPAGESLEEESAKIETPLENDDKPAGESLEEESTKPITTHSETPPPENDEKSCSSDSAECSDEKRGGDTAAPPPRKKHEKGRRKRTRISHKEQEINKKQPVSLSNDPIMSSKDSSEENNKRAQIISRSNNREMVRSKLLDDEKCNLFSGEWVPNPDGPYYTNDSCNAIQEHQNCLKFERPDREFLKWRWKPDDCELPVFDPTRFLKLVRGKSIAFVGDSVARNHMQSLICLLSRVTYPADLSGPLDQNKRYEYREHDFNISMFWAPYLVKTQKRVPNDDKQPFNLYLDEFDEHWTTKIALFDYVIISAGHWFFRPTYFYLNNRLIGCLYCPESNINHLTSYFSYRRAFRTAFRAINAANFNGIAFLRTYAPSHFEGAPWDKGGDCVKKRPYKRNEIVLEDYSLEMYLIQLEELRIAQKTGRRNGGKFRLFDATRAMLLRPDGHPSKYGHWRVANQTFANDCVHWCLPGPIDSWNDFLQELLKREIENSR